MKKPILLSLGLAMLCGCTIRKLQPPQYGTQIVQQVKVLGTKISIPSGVTGSANGGIVEFYLGYVTETVLVIPVVSNVNTNGEVSTNNVNMVSAPLSTAFGIVDSTSGVKLSDNIVSGYEDHTTIGNSLRSKSITVNTNR